MNTNLGLALAAYQQKHDIENGVMAEQIGITPSTLSRVKQGKHPDAAGLMKILAWLTQVPSQIPSKPIVGGHSDGTMLPPEE